MLIRKVCKIEVVNAPNMFPKTKKNSASNLFARRLADFSFCKLQIKPPPYDYESY